MLTLGESQILLSDYAGANQDFTTRINLVCERYLKSGDWSGAKQRSIFAVYVDAQEHAFITLPRQFNSIRTGAYIPAYATCPNGRGAVLPVRNGWYEYSSGGPGFMGDGRSNGFIPLEGRFTTFADWKTPMLLRFKFETSETAGVINIRGVLNGQPIWTNTGTGSAWIEGVDISYTGTTTVTTTQQFDQAPYFLTKPQTKGRVSMYTVDGDGNETLVAIYQPGELNPGWRRYKVPACKAWTAEAPGYFVAVCKLQYNAVINANDEVVPGYIGALRYGLEALVSEDERDFVRANELWELGKKMLCEEINDNDGPGSQGVIQIQDDFAMEEMGYD